MFIHPVWGSEPGSSRAAAKCANLYPNQIFNVLKNSKLTYCFFFSFQACAPRYVYYIFMDRMDPVGMCFTARNNFTQIRPHRPCVESGRHFLYDKIPFQ